LNTQKQAVLIVALMFLLVGSCAAYAAIDLPYRTGLQEDYQFEESVHRGALLYANNCRTCHGNSGEGFVGPALNKEDFRDQDPLVFAANRHLIERTLMCGRAGTLMPAWLNTNGGSLNIRQLEHLVNFLTAPGDEKILEEEGRANEGWVQALEFAHNLNHEVTILVTGDTLVSIARAHNIGVAELANLNGAPLESVDDRLGTGAVVKLPANGARAETTYKVKADNETLRKINASQFVGAATIADLNGLAYRIGDEGLTLLDPQGAPLSGLATGQLLALPDGAVYSVAIAETLQDIAGLHGVEADAIRDLNAQALAGIGDEDAILEPPASPEDPQPSLQLALPKIDAYVTRGQTLDEAADIWGNVTGSSLASANDLPADAVLLVGQGLQLPADAYGGEPPDTPNAGTACVQYAVTNAVFESIFGPPPVVEFEGTVVARGTLFVHTQITLPPATEVTITLDNQDEGILHNIVFFEGPEPGSPAPIIGGCTAGCEAPPDGPADAVRTPWETGLAQSAFTFTTPDAGTYSYLCEIHPTTMRGTLTIEEGATVPGQ
jgi:plastocyanin/mono/diheme cytochrome c family protein